MNGTTSYRRHPKPWHFGTIEMPPGGLREAVARVAYMTLSDCRKAANCARPLIVQSVAWWRLYEPEKWLELREAMKR
jgi:hypothetical protein